MLRAVQSLYTTSTVAMKIDGRVGQTVPSETGVRQGCPLSPMLFGLIFDGLARYIQHHCPNAGAALHHGERVPVLKYADDGSLLTFDPVELQCRIDATVAFCLAIGLPISVVKTVVMVFACDVLVTHVWNCGGHTLSMVDSYKYLGIMLHSSLGVLNACSSLYSRVCHAWAVLRCKYAGLRCAVSVRLLLEVYMVCVPPAGSYACELSDAYLGSKRTIATIWRHTTYIPCVPSRGYANLGDTQIHPSYYAILGTSASTT